MNISPFPAFYRSLLYFLLLFPAVALFAQSIPVDSLRKMSAQADTTQHPDKRGKIYARLSYEYSSIHNDTSLWYARKALAASKFPGASPELRIRALVSMANTLMFSGKADSANLFALTLLDTATKYHDNQFISISYNILGGIAIDKGEYPEALRYYLKQQQLIDADGAVIPANLVNISLVYIHMKEYDKAIPYLEKAITQAEAQGDDYVRIIAYNDLGEVYQQTGQTDKRIGCFLKSLQIARQADDKVLQLLPLDNLAEAYFQKKEFDKAREYAQLVYDLEKEVGNKDIAFSNRGILGLCLMKSAVTQARGLEMLEESLRMAREYGYKEQELLSLKNLVEAYEEHKSLPNRRATLQQYKQEAKALEVTLRNSARKEAIRQEEIQASPETN